MLSEREFALTASDWRAGLGARGPILGSLCQSPGISGAHNYE